MTDSSPAPEPTSHEPTSAAPATPGPLSAARLAEQLGDKLPGPDSVPDAAFDLVERVRELVEAVVMTAVDARDLEVAAGQVEAVTERLRARRRESALYLIRHPDGRVESLVQAGSGRLNPQAPPIHWIVRPTEPPPGSEPRSVECVAHCTFTAAHSGSPSRVHGGMIAAALDECLGVAAMAGGASGMTVALNVNLRGGTPFGVPTEIRARLIRVEGRKTYVTGELTVDGVVTAAADIVCVAERRD
jgi:acyl-coenzyme A thioesterase PaaI-like protein